MTRTVKAIAVALVSASLAVVSLPIGGGSTVSPQSTGCCRM